MPIPADSPRRNRSIPANPIETAEGLMAASGGSATMAEGGIDARMADPSTAQPLQNTRTDPVRALPDSVLYPAVLTSRAPTDHRWSSEKKPSRVPHADC